MVVVGRVGWSVGVGCKGATACACRGCTYIVQQNSCDVSAWCVSVSGLGFRVEVEFVRCVCMVCQCCRVGLEGVDLDDETQLGFRV